jgi:Kef-type K+ transport system membrane component KefB
MPYLPYEEPGITTILSLASFLILLNGSRYALDRFLYCGLLGEILVGIIWGLPIGGTGWLSEGMQETIQSFGYLGLIGLVFEGGLSTDISLLRKNVYLSVSIAAVGLLMPIALSFLLLVFPFSGIDGGTAYPTPLAAFSAGASLCSTSLGTTFAILSSANMQRTRIGVVLVGAAMMDDIVGLVMVNIITTLGHGWTGGWSIARPIAASFGMMLVSLALCPYVLRPAWGFLLRLLRPVQEEAQSTSVSSLRNFAAKTVHGNPHLTYVLSTLVLIMYVTIASFIDASVLLASFIAGGIVSFLWASQCGQRERQPESDFGPMEMYESYYKSAMDYVLVPFFFVSFFLRNIFLLLHSALLFWAKYAFPNIKLQIVTYRYVGFNRLLHPPH